jgi:UDP-N-acetylmuramoylalanine--D-glutamate ligase
LIDELKDCDGLVVSPGVPLVHPLIATACHLGLPVLAETELGLAFVPRTALVVGITGTNGKSTVTHCLAALLGQHYGDSNASRALGNIGFTVCNHVVGGDSCHALAVELSSYQLETMTFPCLDAAIITNLTPDHLARYGDLEGYFRAKWRISSLLRPLAPLALSPSVAHAALRFGGSVGEEHPVWLVSATHEVSPHDRPLPSRFPAPALRPLRAPIAGYVLAQSKPSWVEDHPVHWASVNHTLWHECTGAGSFRITSDQGEPIAWQESMLRGAHNAENLAFCRFAELALLHRTESLLPKIFGGSSDFRNLEHRLEVLPSLEGWQSVTIVNDSKSTSFVCTATALASLTGPVHLVMGGQLKDKDVSAARPAPMQAKLRAVYTFGPEAGWLAQEAERTFATQAHCLGSMEEAVHRALLALKPGETLLFSPGAASFDAFKNFSERGNTFKLKVMEFCSQNSLNTES